MQASLRRLWIQLTADRRRFGLLCVVAAVGLLLWARMIIVSNMPRTAVAGPSGTAPGSGAQTGASTATADKSGASAGTAPSSVGPGTNIPVAIALERHARRDPFVISRRHFPKATQSAPLKPDPGKLPTEAAEDSSLKEARLVSRLTELVSTLKLEAALGGAMAVIDGKTYRTGEPLPAMGNERIEFTLVEIRQRSVVLEFQGRRFEIEMDKPGND
jgi:hypothetical protein